MKKLYASLASVFMALALLCGAQPVLAGLCPIPSEAQAAEKSGEQQVIVYNWSEYIPQDVLDDFTKEAPLDFFVVLRMDEAGRLGALYAGL